MRRREFIKRAGAAWAGATLLGHELYTAENVTSKYPQLGEHKIDKVDIGQVAYNYPRPVGKNARIGHHGQYKKAWYAKLTTNQGAVGWGSMRNRNDIDKDALKQNVMGKTVSELIDPDWGILKEDSNEPFDTALHDLAGVILGLPVYKMLGAAGPKETSVYSGMIYFDELEPEDNPAGVEQVMENCRWDVNFGYRMLKVKIGRSGRWYPHDEGLAMDIRIVKMIHEEFGKDVQILVDANDMYSLQDAKDFMRGVENVPLYWMEEPFVENLEEGRQLKDWMMANGREDTFYADGERQPKMDVCMQLAAEKKMDVMLADIVGYGFTRWRRLMPKLIETGTHAAIHAWGSRLKTHYTSHVAAGFGNSCTLEGVTCLSDEIDWGDYPVENGMMRVSESPGFGMKLLV